MYLAAHQPSSSSSMPLLDDSTQTASSVEEAAAGGLQRRPVGRGGHQSDRHEGASPITGLHSPSLSTGASRQMKRLLWAVPRALDVGLLLLLLGLGLWAWTTTRQLHSELDSLRAHVVNHLSLKPDAFPTPTPLEVRSSPVVVNGSASAFVGFVAYTDGKKEGHGWKTIAGWNPRYDSEDGWLDEKGRYYLVPRTGYWLVTVGGILRGGSSQPHRVAFAFLVDTPDVDHYPDSLEGVESSGGGVQLSEEDSPLGSHTAILRLQQGAKLQLALFSTATVQLGDHGSGFEIAFQAHYIGA